MATTGSTHTGTIPMQRQESGSSFASGAGSNFPSSSATSSPPEEKATPAKTIKLNAQSAEFNPSGSGSVQAANPRARPIPEWRVTQRAPHRHNAYRRGPNNWQRIYQNYGQMRSSYQHVAPPPSLLPPPRPRSESNPHPEEWSLEARTRFAAYWSAVRASKEHGECECEFCENITTTVAKVELKMEGDEEKDGEGGEDENDGDIR